MTACYTAQPLGASHDVGVFWGGNADYSKFGRCPAPASQLLTLSALPIILLLATVEGLHFRRTDNTD
jgi:hypothetical protein